jgi:ABC-type transport system involved in cytochrome c biogenesis permease component
MNGRQRVFWITAVTLFIVDCAIFAAAVNSKTPNLLLGVIGFPLNLPSFPLAAAYVMFLHQPVSRLGGMLMLASEAAVSSIFWGYLVAKVANGRTRAGNGNREMP